MGSTLDELAKIYGDDFRIVFRHFPLSFHDQANMAAQAAIYAQEQGKFWEFHDAIFKHHASLSRDTVERVAKEVGLNVTDLQAALDNKTYAARVDTDTKMGADIGVEGTPAVFLNGRKVEGARPTEDFKVVADKALAQAKGLVSKGTPRNEVYNTLMKMAASDALPPAP